MENPQGASRAPGLPRGSGPATVGRPVNAQPIPRHLEDAGSALDILEGTVDRIRGRLAPLLSGAPDGPAGVAESLGSSTMACTLQGVNERIHEQVRVLRALEESLEI